jgi:hypothetical protein
MGKKKGQGLRRGRVLVTESGVRPCTGQGLGKGSHTGQVLSIPL